MQYDIYFKEYQEIISHSCEIIFSLEIFEAPNS